MLRISKVAWSGIVFLLVTTGFSGPREAPRRLTDNFIKEVPALWHQTDAKIKQQVLHERGDYRGKVDGAFGLRTRASIRAYQKTENLQITGQIDAQTAAGLGLSPESTWGTSQSVGREVGHRNKPSAGVKLTREEQAKRKASKSLKNVMRSTRTAATVTTNRLSELRPT